MDAFTNIVLPIVLSILAGGGASWFLLRANRHKLHAEADKINAEADSIRFETWREGFEFLRSRIDNLSCELEIRDDYIAYLIDGIRTRLNRQIRRLGEVPSWEPKTLTEFRSNGDGSSECETVRVSDETPKTQDNDRKPKF